MTSGTREVDGTKGKAVSGLAWEQVLFTAGGGTASDGSSSASLLWEASACNSVSSSVCVALLAVPSEVDRSFLAREPRFP